VGGAERTVKAAADVVVAKGAEAAQEHLEPERPVPVARAIPVPHKLTRTTTND
jgi:hypothetical protein